MSENTATIETLTAEVRALMIGNRQVTLSVYRQLDWIRPAYCEPFGRVNDHNDVNDGYNIHVVGRGLHTGHLIRARLQTPRPADMNPGTFPQYRRTPEQFLEDEVRFDIWRKLPLIVLAGLR